MASSPILRADPTLSPRRGWLGHWGSATTLLGVALLGVWGPRLAPLAAQSPATADWREAAKKLSAATVTVRIWKQAEQPAASQGSSALAAGPQVAGPAAAGAAPNVKAGDDAGPQVTVLSGVCVAPGRVVTASAAGSDSQIRLTLAGGEQIAARLRVVDDYSGLTLLACPGASLTPAPLAEEAPPEAGSGVLAASAWGVEKPLISVGVVAAAGRTLRGTLLPPLLQCEVRSAETSSGCGVADQAGRLLGVVIAADHPDTRGGWVYAVPVAHVQRLLRVDQERGPPASNAQTAGAQTAGGEPGVVVLKRRRPLVGMVLEGADEQVAVQRITPDGPAHKAGLAVGDRIVSVEGVQIRSVYQAVLPTLHRQPGDVVRFGVARGGQTQQVEVTLGGGVELPAPTQELLGQLLSPRLQVGRDGAGNYYAQPSSSPVREVFAPPLPHEEPEPLRGAPAEKMALLEKALDRYRQVIELQQKELRLREQEIQALQSELSRLKPPR